MSIQTSAFWSIGFRPFFLGAATLAGLAIILWMMVFTGNLTLHLAGLAPVYWHAHEMLFGYATAIIAGFLLTAVPNWTQSNRVTGWSLVALLCCWALPRLLFLLPLPGTLGPIIFFDLIFICVITVVLVRPIAGSGQLRRQAGIVSKLVLLALTHAVFFAAFLLNDLHWLQTSLYAALYLIVALCLALARRLVPFFVQSATNVELPNSDGIDRASLWLFLGFWASVIATGHGVVTALLAASLFGIHAYRLWGWRTTAALSSPLLWVLYAAYGFFLLGFLLLVLQPLLGVPLSAAVHAFAVGGIGTLTIGMMSRVSWGHTGRNIGRPPRLLGSIFGLMIIAAMARVGSAYMPPSAYLPAMLFAASAWVAAFTLFLLAYVKVLVGPRAEG